MRGAARSVLPNMSSFELRTDSPASPAPSLGQSRLARRISGVLLVAGALAISAASTAFAIRRLADLSADLKRY